MTAIESYVQAFQQGDVRAFEYLVRHFQASLVAMAYARLGDWQQSEDLAQQSFVVAWQKRLELVDGGRFGAWLRGILRNLIANTRRRRTERPGEATNGDAWEGLPDAQPSPLHAAIEKEEHHLLRQVLASLPETYREPLVLFYFEGESVARVAEMMELSTEAVKQRLQRGRKMLKEEVAQFVEERLSHRRPQADFTKAVLAAAGVAGGSATQAALAQGAAAAGKAGALGKSLASAGSMGTVGAAGALGGTAIGLAGAYYGSRQSLKAATSDQERRFLYKLIGLATGLVLVQLATLFGVRYADPQLYATPAFQLSFWGAYTTLLLALIVWGNRRIRAIKLAHGTEEEKAQLTGAAPPHVPLVRPGQVAVGLAGGLFGATLWMMILSVVAHAWITLAGIVVTATLVWAGLSVRAYRIATVRDQLRLVQVSFLATSLIVSGWTLAAWPHWEAAIRAFGQPVKPVAGLPLPWVVAALVILFGIGLAAALELRVRRQGD